MASFPEWKVSRRDHRGPTWSLPGAGALELESFSAVPPHTFAEPHDVRFQFYPPNELSRAAFFIDTYRTKEVKQQMLSLVWAPENISASLAWASGTTFIKATLAAPKDASIKWFVNYTSGIEQGFIDVKDLQAFDAELKWAESGLSGDDFTGLVLEHGDTKFEIDLASPFGAEKQAVLFWPATARIKSAAFAEVLTRFGCRGTGDLAPTEYTRLIRDALEIVLSPEANQ